MDLGVLVGASATVFFVGRFLTRKGAVAANLRYEPTGIKVDQLKLDHAILQVRYRLTNPTPGRANLNDLFLVFAYQGRKLGEAAVRQPVQIPAAGSVDLSAEVRVDYASAGPGFVAIARQLISREVQQVDIDITGTMRVDGVAVQVATTYPITNPLGAK